MSVIQHSFEAINAQLDSMNATNQTLMAKREELDAELTHWAGYWDGDAFIAATQWSRNVTQTLDAVIAASTQYVGKARLANEDMRGQEAANTSLWA